MRPYRRFQFFVPRDAVAEVHEVLNTLMREGETTNVTAAFLYLIRAQKADIMAVAEAKRRAEGGAR